MIPVKHHDTHERWTDAPGDEKVLLDSALDALPDAFILFDLDGKAVRWNPAVNRLTGYSDEKRKSMSLEEFVAEEDRLKLSVTMAGALAGARNMPFTLEIITSDGTNVPFEFVGTVLRDSDGEPMGFCGIGRDITERKRAEAALHAINRELHGYAHTVSHDLRGPVAELGCEALAALLARGPSEDSRADIERTLWLLEKNIQKAGEIVRDLLEFAEAGQSAIEV